MEHEHHHRTVVALYPDLTQASRALADLEQSGIADAFAMYGNATTKAEAGLAGLNDLGPKGTSAPAVLYDTAASRIDALTDAGIPRAEAEVMSEAVRRGAVLLVGRVDEPRCRDVEDRLDRHAPVDVDERAGQYRATGWAGYDPDAADYDEAQVAEERGRYAGGLGAAASSLGDLNRQPLPGSRVVRVRTYEWTRR
ncbi:hypothetical protein [Azospirillum sp.]|uniref:hypothetical protein n=1 Tax=Azospirillum sp. TaxID=34012 RepID=UPI003D7547DB